MRKPDYFSGKPIESLQTMLRFISEEDPGVLPVIPNGIYDSSTYASVRSFQNTDSRGSVDQTGWQTIVDRYDQILPHRTVPSTQPAWSVSQSVKPGMFNYHLYLVQAMLAALSDFFPDLSVPDLTGTLDPVTQEGLSRIQAASGIAATGELNTATWNYLNALYRAMIGDGNK